MDSGNVLLIRLGKTMTSIHPNSRRRGLQIIERFILKHRSSLNSLQMIKLWKGLYYCLWLADKVPIQREIAINISKFQRLFTSVELWNSFIYEFYNMLTQRWDIIDRLRMDKFMFLQRVMIAESLDIIKKKEYDKVYIEHLLNTYQMCIFTTSGIGISLIFCHQFPQEFVYFLNSQFSENKCNHERSNINILFELIAELFVNIIRDCNNRVVIKTIHEQLIRRFTNIDSLLKDSLIGGLLDISDITISQYTKEVIDIFLQIVCRKLFGLASSKEINQSNRNILYKSIEIIESAIPKIQNIPEISALPINSKNKRNLINEESIKSYKPSPKKVRFDMSQNMRMLLPDSLATSKALVKLFARDNSNKKQNDEIKCVLVKQQSNKQVSEKNNIGDSEIVEVIPANEALSKPPDLSHVPLKSILKKREFA
ncbi:nucleolar protein NOP52 [Cryptosporidium andersoni]|uniref:Nucleolar protein NOP52 n=1 Tax=Cryptosporidium andersoni TaxID=117008 RepID=A0A1J4MX04_9CRYT|nr:nucleolar protein NOP52 [Cryptosporidium andersoni]